MSGVRSIGLRRYTSSFDGSVTDRIPCRLAQFENAATEVQLKALLHLLDEMRIDPDVQRAGIIDIRKAINNQVVLPKHSQKQGNAEDAVCIELEALDLGDRHGKIEPSPRLQHTYEIPKALAMALIINRIAIASEPEMFQHVQAGQRIRALGQFIVGLHDVRLPECDSLRIGRQPTNVEHLDLTERGHVSNKPVDA